MEEIFTTSIIIHKEGAKIFYEEGTNIVMTSVERYDKLLQLSTIRALEIETEIESGELDELRDLNENINGIMKKLQQWIDTIQDEMLDGDKSLDEIKQWIANQKQELDQF